MDVCRSRMRRGDGVQLPVAYLVCNFAPPAGGMPSLLTHDDVVTLFHEFGHGLHHMLTEVDLPSVAGIEGVEWDAVELPSQFLENYAWHRESLDLFARHWQTGEPLPQALLDKMLAARHFQAGMFLVRQLEFALFDFRLHLEYDPARGARVMELLEEVRDEVAVIRPPAWAFPARVQPHLRRGLCRRLLQLSVGRGAGGRCVLGVRGQRSVRRGYRALPPGDPRRRRLAPGAGELHRLPRPRTGSRCPLRSYGLPA